MRGQKLILVKGVYSLEKWTKPNPLMSTENRPVDISSVNQRMAKCKQQCGCRRKYSQVSINHVVFTKHVRWTSL